MGYPTAPPIELVVRGPLHRSDLAGLSRRVCALLDASAGRVVHCRCVDVAADAVAVDALARMQVLARRQDCLVVLCGVTPELRGLVTWMGLVDVLPEKA